MADSMPDLIQRAAARLERTPAGGSTIERAVAQEIPAPTPAPPPPPTARPEANYSGSVARQRTLTVSPAHLAAHGIALPGSGFSRTVEEFRSIKRHVLSATARARGAPNPGSSRIMLITSARPGDGKTFAA